MATPKIFDEKTFSKIAEEVEAEWRYSGLSDGLYYEFAKEAARRYIRYKGLKEED